MSIADTAEEARDRGPAPERSPSSRRGAGPTQLRRNLVLLSAALLALVVAAIGALSSYQKVQSFQPLGFDAEPQAGHWLVTAVHVPGTGLQPGDQILQLSNQEAGHLAGLGRLLRERPTAHLVVLRDSELVSVLYQRPPLDIDYPYLILALIGVGYLLVGFYTVLRDQKQPAAIFYLWCLTSAVVYLASFTSLADWSGRLIYVADEAARVLLAPLTLHLFLIFPQPAGGAAKRRRRLPFVYLPAALLLAAQLDAMFLGGRWLAHGDLRAALGMLDQLELYHLVAFALAAAGLLVWRLYRRTRPEPRRQAMWIAVGMLGGYLPFSILYLLPRSLGVLPGSLQSSLAVLPLALVPLTFAYAILRYKLWDIGNMVRGAASLTLTVLVGVLGFAMANLAVSRAVPADLGSARTMLSFISGLMIAGLMVPTRRKLDGSLERLQYRGTFQRRRSLTEFGRDLLYLRDLGDIALRLVRQIEETFFISDVALYLDCGGRMQPVPTHSDLPADLPVGELEPGFWDLDVQPLSGVELGSGEPSPANRWFVAGFRYAFPLRVRNDRLGALVVGYKRGDTPLSGEDLDLLRNLLNQVSLALENAQLLEEVKDQLSQVTRLQHDTREIIESSPAGIVVLGGDDAIESVNHAFARLVGLETEALRGERLEELLPVTPLPRPEDGLREVSYRDSAGNDRYLQLSAAPLEEGPDGVRRVVVVHDVTERVAMENELKEKERLAALGMLAAGVAHEVNTPLTGISSYAQMLLDDTPRDDPRRAIMEKVERQTFRAARIVNNLLEFSRDRPRELRQVDMGSMLDECLDLLSERIADGGSTLEWKRPGAPVTVRANDGELQQVFTNLVVNAVDAMAPAGGLVTVSLDADDRWVRATVADTGPGIPPDKLQEIFKPFYSTKLSKGGTGLGLSISYSIVRRCGGELRVASQPGQGCRFIVELPRDGAGQAR